MPRFLTISLLTTLLLAGSLAAPIPAQSDAQRNADRRARLREHEERIRAIIEQRREEARKREQEEEQRRREEAAQQASERAEDGEDPAAAQDTIEEDAQLRTAVSSVVMGFKFVNEEGVSDYNIIVTKGETFVTEVKLFNIDRNPIDRLRLALDFDKRFIRPVKVFDTAIRGRIDGEPAFNIDERAAILNYDATFTRPLMGDEITPLRILWQATRDTPYTGIDFAFDELEEDQAAHTAVYARGKNILGVDFDPADGVLSGGLMITPPPSVAPVLQGKGEELRDLYLGSVASDDSVGIHLGPPRGPVRVGEEFSIPVRLNNPEGALIDAVNFYVAFDPEVLQVVDKDQFNWITRGINVHDGPFHANFPWDMHKRNEVRNDRGIVNYQMSASNGQSLPSKTMARIHFMAIRPARETNVYLVKGRPQDIAKTSIRYFGFERLSLEPEYSRPLLQFPVLPAPIEVVQQQQRDQREAQAVAEEDTRVRSLKIERN